MRAKARLEALLLQFALHFAGLRLEVARFVRLEAVMAKQFSQVDASKLIALSSGFELLKQQTGGQWRWGTACSGSEVVFCALEALWRFWVPRVADVPEIEHAFSCEQVEFKRGWIHEFFSPQHMFADIHRLSGGLGPRH